MKSLRTVSLLIGISWLLNACTSDDALTPNPDFVGNATAQFTADIDGMPVSFSNAQANFFQGRISMGAFSGNTRISFLMDGQTTGVYVSNASASNFIQFETDTSDATSIHSTQAYSVPNGSVFISSIDASTQTMSGTFSGELRQFFSLTGDVDSISVTNGVFSNIPYNVETGNVFNFGKMDFEENGIAVSMNTASASIATGDNNGTLYDYYSISTATSNFDKSIELKIDDSRMVEGTTTFFTDDYSGPFNGASNDSLAQAFYSTGMTTTYESISGSVTITKIEMVNNDERISGTFSFEGEEFAGSQRIQITNGVFEAIKRN